MKERTKVILLCVLVMLGVIPTLGWHDFRDVMENFVVVTADEVVRDGTWMVPTLGGEVRLQKPPLAHWTTAAGLYLRNWGWDEELAARLPSFLMALGAIPGVYVLARLLFGKAAGFPAAVVLATSYFFLKYDRRASYDAQLLLFVTWGLVGLVWAIGGSWWRGMALAGVCIGLGFLTKGPPVLLMTIVPVLVWSLLKWCGVGDEVGLPRSRTIVVTAVVVGVVLFLLIGLGWFFYVGYLMPNAAEVWQGQATLRNERQIEQISKLEGLVNLLVLAVMAAPWLGWLVAGIGKLWVEERRRFGVEWVAVLLMVLPGPLMVLFGLVRERYLFPCVLGAALLAGSAIAGLHARWRRDGLERFLVEFHWVIVGGMAVAMGVGAVVMRVEGAMFAGPALVLIGVGLVVWGRVKDNGWLLWAPVVVILLTQGLFFWCDQFTPGGRSTAKPAARELAAGNPNAEYFYLGGTNGMPLEFCYYLGHTVRLVRDPDRSLPGGAILFVEEGKPLQAPPGTMRVGEYTYRNRTWAFHRVVAEPRGLADVSR